MFQQPARLAQSEGGKPSLPRFVSRVIVAATFTGQSRRLRLDPLELAACALGARITEMQVRHGHVEAWLPDHKIASEKLLARLERLRKRAKRACIRARGHAA